MLDPKDMKVIDDLRFKTGHEIIPYVITELRLLNAFEKYYGIKKELRYISIRDRFAPETEIKNGDIERSESAFAQRGYREKQAEEFSAEKLKGTLSEARAREAREQSSLIGALLSNAFYTARFFYLQEGKTFTDNEIEDKVIERRLRLAKKNCTFSKRCPPGGKITVPVRRQGQ